MSIDKYKKKNLLRKGDTYIPILSNSREKLNYYSDRIIDLEHQIDKLKDEIKQLKKYRAYKDFYESLSGYCMDTNVNMNILQCSFRKNNNKCRVNIECKTRKNFLKQIGI